MKISTKGRYAIRVIMDLVEHDTGEYISLMDIAKRQQISEKYLEAIISVLKKNDFVYSFRGKGGGYRPAKRAEEYTIRSILQATEGPLVPVACLEKKPNQCERVAECKTIRMWEGLEKVINDYLENITIADLLNESTDGYNYVI